MPLTFDGREFSIVLYFSILPFEAKDLKEGDLEKDPELD